MNSKKVTTLGLLILGLGTLSATQLFANSSGNQSFQTNVVYSQSDATKSSQEEEALKLFYTSKTTEALEKYFNITIPDDKQPEYYVTLISEKSIQEDEAHWLDVAQAEFNQKKISADQLADYQLKQTKISTNLRNKLAMINHDYVECSWYQDDEMYAFTFNANTTELIDIQIPGYNKTKASNVDFKKLELLGADYIKIYQLGDIIEPQLLQSHSGNNAQLFYEDKTDSSKKVLLWFNPTNYKLIGFSTNSYADMMYTTYNE